MMWVTLLLALAALLGAPAGAQDNDQAFSVRRFLLAVGNNSGGPERGKLRYAVSDAQGIAKVFEELGGVERQDRMLLLETTPAELKRALADLGARVAQAARENSRVELVVYYSGHSDEIGLLLGDELLPYPELRAGVDAVPADVRIIVLDSCASGAFTRLKGGQRRPPFLLDASAKMKGHAFLTSSSHDEAAQESDRIGGSFFTNALVSGLRGAADATQDQRVTLNEAYQFAFHTTLARTEGTQSGPQHPGYDIQLVGAGDLVITDLRSLTAGLVLPEQMQGRLHVRDDRDALVVELQKPAGRQVELGLEPGTYRIFLDHEGRYYTAALTLSDNGLTPLDVNKLFRMSPEETAARGEFPVREPEPVQPREIIHRGFSASLWPGMSTNRNLEERVVSDVSLNLTIGRNHGVSGLEVGYIGNWNLGDVKGVQLAGGLNLVEGNLNALQVSTFVNRVNGNVRGLQASSMLNSVGGHLDGAQVGYVLNILSGGGRGLQAGTLLNVAGRRFEGAQLAALVNTAQSIDGLQAAGLWNHMHDPARACQIGGIGNMAGALEGAQLGGVFGYAGELRGLQLALVNFARAAEGAQIGVVNVAGSVRGTQIGVVNAARRVDGAPVGIVNLIQHGRQNLAVWTADTGDAMLGVKLGNERAYSVLCCGTEQVGGRRHYAGLGLGLHVPVRHRAFGTFDLLSQYIFEEKDPAQEAPNEDLHMLHLARLGLGWQVSPRFAVVGGPTVNVYTSGRQDGADLVGSHTWHSERSGDTWVSVWPGFFLAIQI